MKNLLIVVAVMFGFSAFAAGMDDASTVTTKTVKHKHHTKVAKKAAKTNSSDVEAAK
jgi:hypothetical protein